MGDRLATLDMGRKVAGGVPLSMGGELQGPHLAHCRLRRGLPSYKVVHPTACHNTRTLRRRQTDRQDRTEQRSDSIGRTVFTNGRPKNGRYYRTLIGNPMLEVELTGQRGRVATGSGQMAGVLEADKLIVNVSKNKHE